MYEIGRRFLFLINKIENNTIHITQILQQNQSASSDVSSSSSTTNGVGLNFENGTAAGDCSTSGVSSYFDAIAATASTASPVNSTGAAGNGSTLASLYDSSGAANYIVVVVLVYGFAIIFFIGSQVRSTKKFSDEVDGVNAEKILRSMETEIFTKEVLEKLSNKEHRERAWKIYLSKPTTTTTATAAAGSGTSPSHSRRASVASIGHHRLSVSGGSSPQQQQQGHSLKEIEEQSQLEPLRRPSDAIFNDESLRQIDKTAVSSIEKKLKLLNKVQSNYRVMDNKEAEIETVKEVLHQKTPRAKSSSSKYKSILKNFELKSKRANETSKSSAPPKIVLQTDDEGLYKLKQSKSSNSSSSKSSSKKRSTMKKDVADANESRSSPSTSRSNYAGEDDDDDDNDNVNRRRYSVDSCVSFDVCEISEKITSV